MLCWQPTVMLIYIVSAFVWVSIVCAFVSGCEHLVCEVGHPIFFFFFSFHTGDIHQKPVLGDDHKT